MCFGVQFSYDHCQVRGRATSLRRVRAEHDWDGRRSGAEVRAPAHLRRLSSFSSADWLPHAKCASWGFLGLTLGDRRCRSQIWWRIPRTGTVALATASLLMMLYFSVSELDVVARFDDRPDKSNKLASNGGDHDRSFFRRDGIRRYRAQSRTCAFQAGRACEGIQVSASSTQYELRVS